jgi:hypothetical protein
MTAEQNNNISKPVYSFGEKDEKNKWYAHEDGVRIKCNEQTISKLYYQWVVNPTAQRADDGEYYIYKATEPGLSL